MLCTATSTTGWHTIPLKIGNILVSEIDAKLEIGFIQKKHDWDIFAIIVEGDSTSGNHILRLDPANAGGIHLGNDTIQHSYMGHAIATSAAQYFSEHRADIFKEIGLEELEDEYA